MPKRKRSLAEAAGSLQSRMDDDLEQSDRGWRDYLNLRGADAVEGKTQRTGIRVQHPQMPTPEKAKGRKEQHYDEMSRQFDELEEHGLPMPPHFPRRDLPEDLPDSLPIYDEYTFERDQRLKKGVPSRKTKR